MDGEIHGLIDVYFFNLFIHFLFCTHLLHVLETEASCGYGVRIDMTTHCACRKRRQIAGDKATWALAVIYVLHLSTVNVDGWLRSSGIWRRTSVLPRLMVSPNSFINNSNNTNNNNMKNERRKTPTNFMCLQILGFNNLLQALFNWPDL